MQEVELRKGPWLEEEDEQLSAAVAVFGDKRWDALAKSSGLRRNGKSCRLRWMNYLRPNLKHGNISADEERIIIQLHEKWGNKWSMIARRLPGRTDNEIKNYWRSYLKKKALALDKECLSSTTNICLRSEECETDSPCSVNDEIVGPTTDSSDALDIMLNMTSSPYETRLTEWMMSSNCDTRKTDYRDEFLNYDLCFTERISDDYAMWDFSLWDGE